MEIIIKKYIKESEQLNTIDDMEVCMNNITTIISKMIAEVEICYGKNEYSKSMLKLEILVCLFDEVGYSYAIKMPEDNQKYKNEALNRLFMITIKAFREVVYLLNGGFTSAALAHTRFIFETVVFMDIINGNNEGISEKFLKHSTTNRLKISKRYNDQISKELIERQLKNLGYGDNFYKDYQWASLLLENKKKITFKDLVELTSLDDLYYLYSFLSDYVHANIYTSLYGIDSNEIENGKSIWITTPSAINIEEVTKIILLMVNKITLRFSSSGGKELLITAFLANLANVDISAT